MNRFQKVYTQGTIDVMEIWADTETGVHYVFHRNGSAAGFTPLLGPDGKPPCRSFRWPCGGPPRRSCFYNVPI